MKKWVAILAASGVMLSGVAMASVLQKVNINAATAKQLASVKGIGSKRAAAIVAYRKQHGRFKSLNDLTNVKGISEKSLVRLEKRNPNRLVLK